MSSINQLSFNSSPSGKEILYNQMKQLLEEYNVHAEEEKRVFEAVKKTLDDEHKAALAQIEAVHYNNQIKMHKKMEAVLSKMQDQFALLETEEDELRKFTEGLTMFMMDMKKTK